MVGSNTIMDKKEEALWIKTFKLCGLYKHPSKLTNSQKKHQRLLLDAISQNPKAWPESEKLQEWYTWHEESALQRKKL